MSTAKLIELCNDLARRMPDVSAPTFREKIAWRATRARKEGRTNDINKLTQKEVEAALKIVESERDVLSGRFASEKLRSTYWGYALRAAIECIQLDGVTFSYHGRVRHGEELRQFMRMQFNATGFVPEEFHKYLTKWINPNANRRLIGAGYLERVKSMEIFYPHRQSARALQFLITIFRNMADNYASTRAQAGTLNMN